MSSSDLCLNIVFTVEDRTYTVTWPAPSRVTADCPDSCLRVRDFWIGDGDDCERVSGVDCELTICELGNRCCPSCRVTRVTDDASGDDASDDDDASGDDSWWAAEAGVNVPFHVPNRLNRPHRDIPDITIEFNTHWNCYCQREGVCGCGCDERHDGWTDSDEGWIEV